MPVSIRVGAGFSTRGSTHKLSSASERRTMSCSIGILATKWDGHPARTTIPSA
jgi:hypothetical protein